jgi:hypothetical protein
MSLSVPLRTKDQFRLSLRCTGEFDLPAARAPGGDDFGPNWPLCMPRITVSGRTIASTSLSTIDSPNIVPSAATGSNPWTSPFPQPGGMRTVPSGSPSGVDGQRGVEGDGGIRLGGGPHLPNCHERRQYQDAVTARSATRIAARADLLIRIFISVSIIPKWGGRRVERGLVRMRCMGHGIEGATRYALHVYALSCRPWVLRVQPIRNQERLFVYPSMERSLKRRCGANR